MQRPRAPVCGSGPWCASPVRNHCGQGRRLPPAPVTVLASLGHLRAPPSASWTPARGRGPAVRLLFLLPETNGAEGKTCQGVLAAGGVPVFLLEQADTHIALCKDRLTACSTVEETETRKG